MAMCRDGSEIIMKKITIIILALVMLMATLTGFVVLMNNSPFSSIHNADKNCRWIDGIITGNNLRLNIMGQTGTVTIHALAPDVPASFPLYKGIFRQGDYVAKSFDIVFKDRINVTSEHDAPEIAQKVLAPYGGLPPDAELSLAETNYYELIKPFTHEIVERKPIYTDVFYHRVVDGMPVLGFSDKIQVTLGEDGKVLEILKIWRTLEHTGQNVSIISAQAATYKLLNGEVMDPPKGMDDVQIHTIKLGYYEKSRIDPIVFLEPIWIFQGNKTSGTPEEFSIYARQFANFTATPTTGKVPLAVTFTDTSDATPIQWYWDLGRYQLNCTEPIAHVHNRRNLQRFTQSMERYRQ
jgi:hypothetical protein